MTAVSSNVNIVGNTVLGRQRNGAMAAETMDRYRTNAVTANVYPFDYGVVAAACEIVWEPARRPQHNLFGASAAVTRIPAG